MSDGRRIGYLEQVDWIALATLCDLPVTVIPIGLTPGGLPVGVQIIGAPGADAATLAIAAALEPIAGGYRLAWLGQLDRSGANGRCEGSGRRAGLWPRH